MWKTELTVIALADEIQTDKIMCVKNDCYINSDRRRSSNPQSNRSFKSKDLKSKSNPLTNKSSILTVPSNSNLPESLCLPK